ncbi:unnamed protein product, partial [marine sediment metagenome]
ELMYIGLFIASLSEFSLFNRSLCSITRLQHGH